MQDSSLRHLTFTVGFKRAYVFLRSLIAMKEMVSSARLIVKTGEIQVLATSDDRDANASLVMEASTAASWTYANFAVQFDLSDWINLLASRVNEQDHPVWIYKIGDSPHLFCSLGNDGLSPMNLGEAIFVEEEGMDIESLRSHRVTVKLKSECLREIIWECASTYDHVMMLAKKDRVDFITASGILGYYTKDGDCATEHVEAGTAWYLLLEWRGALILDSASWLSDEILMSYLTDEEWKDWILFSCMGDEQNFFGYMMRGSDTQIVHTQ